jgi:hypothetical protein
LDEGTRQERSQTIGRAISHLLWVPLAIGGLVWLVAVFYLPYQRPFDQQVSARSEALASVRADLATELGYKEIRSEPRGGNNLEIYLQEHDFQNENREPGMETACATLRNLRLRL